MQHARLAVDIGGTFTDLALEHPGGLATLKVLTTPAEPERGVLEGVAEILRRARVGADAVGLVIHGTTLATNAIIERKGARTALVTTQGFRDVLAMGNESRYDQYDLDIVLPDPLVPRYLRLTVPERLDNEGRVLLPLDENAVRALVPVLRAERVESIAIGFLHAFVDPQHERRARDIIAAELPDLAISLSSEVSPEMREWERFSTTAANAYVQPLMARYLRGLAAGLREAGLAGPLFLMLSGGGLTTLDAACRFPIRLVESGPAGGALFTAGIARQCGIPSVVSFDMGGTTAKICLIDDYAPQTARSFEVARVGRFKRGSGLPLRIPVIEMVEIGAGGGSLAHVDALGRIAVGPESAGADPGPACYGRGATRPAVTDANLLLGRYDPERFAGGALRLVPEAARQATQTALGAPLGLDAEMAALGIVEMVDENMANAARVHAIESGKSFGDRVLIAFGGGGPVHATRIAEKLGIARVLVPSGAGVGSAIGFLRAPVGYEVVRSLYQRLSRLDVPAVNALLAAMEQEAEDVVRQGIFGEPLERQRIGFMRYLGQGHEIAVALPARALGPNDAAAIRDAYEAEYRRVFDRPVPGSEIEATSWAVIVATAPRAVPAAGSAPSPHDARPARRQRVRDSATGALADWPVFDRAALSPGSRIAGPAIVAEDETSTLLGAVWSAAVDAQGYLHLTRGATP
ncbi:MAG TPA: hydantoinase/oxoprolinase family protein [Acetobacteraceae bacterium]|nr:hydantoinase/oxoprolinase family protein [Acetobacteraceae bacterium]